MKFNLGRYLDNELAEGSFLLIQKDKIHQDLWDSIKNTQHIYYLFKQTHAIFIIKNKDLYTSIIGFFLFNNEKRFVYFNECEVSKGLLKDLLSQESLYHVGNFEGKSRLGDYGFYEQIQNELNELINESK